MTQSQMHKASRPLAAGLAALLTTAFWLPTVSAPAEAADHRPIVAETGTHVTIVIAAPSAPALM
ncbi:hypothetical protein [Sphingomonas sp. IC081]|uniref:hypothetical protein n=1 Tax=Sphingomonas sp. IC081 TaxID=304378 RepID=UPI00115963F3|nr:hypothetical protein [Sphingomonas sp. IC081]QDK34594.1 hypothetical protein DM450_17795 [Sphingomonas sp. IC081]